MQAIIMAAGKGSRIDKITNGLPKSFLPIGDTTLIDYNVNALFKLGADEIIIVTGYRWDAFEERFGNDARIIQVFNPFFSCANVLSSFWVGQSLLRDDFIYLHADTICDIALLRKIVETSPGILLPIDFKKCDEEAMKVKVVRGKVVEINKTMSPEYAAGEFIGIAKFPQKTISDLCANTVRILKNGRLDAYFEEAVQRTINQNIHEINCISTENHFWAEIDFVEDYKRACDYFSNMRGEETMKYIQEMIGD
jgi:choline kinase